jgi:hypothetical protein
MIAALVPFLTVVVAAWLVFARARPNLALRESFLVSTTVAAGWLVLGIELLSLFHAIHFWPVLLWWLAPLLACSAILLEQVRAKPLSFAWPKLRWIDRLLIGVIMAVMGWSLCQAVFSPPNNVDSQEYHLQRQVFWMQQASVENYPTNNARQLAMPPLAEFAGLTLMVLTGNDQYHNLVQWFALLVSLCAVSLTTRIYNPSATAQLLAAVWVVTIPLAFLQASTTKNDVVVLMWISILIYWIILLARPIPRRWSLIGLIGLGFGLLVLTKGTGLIFGLPLALVAGIVLLRNQPRVAVPALLLISGVALLVNVGALLRNYQTFDSIAPDKPGIHDGPTVGSDDYSLLAVVSSMARNIGSHLVSPFQPWNDRLVQGMIEFHELLGRDINDPYTTWMPGGRFRPYQFWQDDEDKAAAPAHMLLLLVLPVAMLWTRRELPWRAILALLFVFMAGFVLFSLLLKWQNWNVRLIIALPAILAPVFGWTFGASRMRYVVLLPVILLVATLTASFNSLQHPMWGPKNIFQADPLALRCYYHPEWPQQYRDLVERIEKLSPHVVGFATWPGSPDYPIQRLLLDGSSSPTFTAFNAAVQIPGKHEPDPDVVLVSRSNPRRLQHVSTGTWYNAQARIGRFTLLTKE